MSYYPNVYASQTGPLLLSGLDANFNFAVDIQSQSLYASAGGSSDIITATLTPAVTSLISGLTLYIRAATANTTTTPTFSPNSLTAKTIVKANNIALAVGDIAGSGHILILQYDATNGVWELANPATANTSFPGGTANGVLYLNGSKIATSGAALTFDGTNFATTGTATATKLIPTGTSVTGNGLYLPAANALGLSTNGTNAVYIDSSQNVGIGTSSPSSPLNVVSASSSLAIAINGRSSDNLGAMYFYANNGSTQYSTIIASATEFRLSSVPAAAVQTFYTNGSERMRIDSSGNVGIGTSSPSTRLSVSSSGANGVDLAVDQGNSAASARLFFSNGTAGQGYSISNDTGALKFNRSATSGSATGTESMRIDSSGNVGIGTSSPLGKLNVDNGTIYVGASGNVSQQNVLLRGYGYYVGATIYGDVSIRSTYTSSNNTGSLEFYTSNGSGSSTRLAMTLNPVGSLSIYQATTAAAPVYVKGAMYFDTTLNKLRIGGATAWETVTSV